MKLNKVRVSKGNQIEEQVATWLVSFMITCYLLGLALKWKLIPEFSPMDHGLKICLQTGIRNK